MCDGCKRVYDNAYHANRSIEQKQRKQRLQVLRIQENRAKVHAYLTSKECEMCGEKDPVVLEFDHIDQDDKFRTIANMMHFSWEAIFREILKCRVLCANCHRRHTATQLGWRKG